jgi:exosome complex RNA-binding protein Rrp42 (RNase PH superfamily)
MALVDDKIIADPTSEEESLASCIANIVRMGPVLGREDGQLCLVDIVGESSLSPDHLLHCLEQSKVQTKKLCSAIRAEAKERQ